jgi:hypothetical protein
MANPLDHPVYGLMKKADGVHLLNSETLLDNPFWKSGIRANDLPFDAEYTTDKNIIWAISQMNQHADGLKQPNPTYRPLECVTNPCYSNVSGPGDPYDDTDDLMDDMEKFVKCLSKFSFINADSCTFGLINNLPIDVVSIIFNDINKPDKPRIEIPVREYRQRKNQNDNGNSLNKYIKNNRKLTSSLYEIAFVMDNLYFPLIEELIIEEELEEEIQMADLLNAIIFPVPLIGNEFNIKLNADEILKVLYTLHDANGTELHRQNINVPKNQEITRTIRPKTNIPNGIILHRFTFDDGSVKTIETIKN